MPKQGQSPKHVKPSINLCPGPKIHAFKHQSSPIEWLERIDTGREDHSGAEGVVFKVKIKSQLYALKVFDFFDPSKDRYFWGPLLSESFPLEKIVYYTDPFYAECRAYGRIHEAQRKRKIGSTIVVPCHGYLFLGDRDRRQLKKKGIIFNSKIIDKDLRKAIGQDTPLRAIVKELAPEESGIGKAGLTKVLMDIRSLNSIKIYNRDIRAENFRGRRLVDFGRAWTEPHCILNALDDAEARDTKLEDLVMFDEMIEDEGVGTKLRAMPNMLYCEKLRSFAS
ncbi:uncharacterized protein JN550_002359 [Neoarthrinium moseri]|uniref:uncharacterized protein n=1 Tax=Neoarthrinium moseri TaxID=1658444 RepID=UPI001FDD0278|nr:uncharacterized protein JN550_002359 [Neoarthrinium moseri]KAI1874930.1 hypothetical protein JN550_002359 [Neoarthrinium moseri]